MNKITLQKVIIDNFKSFKHYEHEFGHQETISGHFGCGKSTIRKSLDFVLAMKVDDFRPCYFSDNEWKEIEAVGSTNVEWYITVEDSNGIVSNYKLQVVSDDKGTKYYVDDLKISTKTKYQEQLVNIFGLQDYDTLLLITHLDNFLELDWNKQRETLKRLTNADKALEEIKNSEKYKDLKEFFDKGFGEIEIKKALAKQKKDLESEKDKTIGALREQESVAASYENIDYNSIEKEIQELDQQIRDLSSDTIASQLKEKELELQNAKAKIDLFTNKDNSNLAYLEGQKKGYLERINNCKEEIRLLDNEIGKIQNSEIEYNDYENTCPYCGSVIEPKSHEEQDVEFEEQKLLSVNEIVKEQKKFQKEVDDINDALKQVDNNIQSFKNQMKEHQIEIDNLNELCEVLEFDIEHYKSIDNSQKINELQIKKTELINKLSGKSIYNLAKTRIVELNNKKNDLLKQIQRTILLENLRNDYSLDTMNIIENHINSYFSKDVHWKLFSQLITTGEYKEDLILIAGGKRYDTACSNGERILAKIAVVIGLQKILDTNCFIFVDDFNDLGVGFKVSQQLILLETKSERDLANVERF